MGRKRLFFDIEVSPNMGFFWNPGHKINIGYENIIKERAVICICYKWEGEKQTHSLQWDSKQNDKKILAEFIKVANKADELVGHNGDKFDLSWIRTRCLFHKIEMFPQYVTVDTLKVARSKFRFNSNRLDYIGKFLGLGKKLHTGFDLWKNIVLNNDEKAMNKMVRYCKQDVVLLEKIYTEMKNHIAVKSHFGRRFLQDRGSCPECGSDDLRIVNHRFTASGTKKVQYVCKTCHKHHTKVDREKMEVKNGR
jgi:DNA polymerase elongation subunit (family B)